MRVLTIGTFDLYHAGHDNLLWRCVDYFGDESYLYVGVNSDRFVEQYKGQRPVQDEETRLARVRKHGWSPWATINDGPGDALIRQIKPNLLVIGSDWHDRYLPQINMSAEELFDELRCGIVYLPRTPDVSTTELRREA